jgi:hypothetical protein
LQSHQKFKFDEFKFKWNGLNNQKDQKIEGHNFGIWWKLDFAWRRSCLELPIFMSLTQTLNMYVCCMMATLDTSQNSLNNTHLWA